MAGDATRAIGPTPNSGRPVGPDDVRRPARGSRACTPSLASGRAATGIGTRTPAPAYNPPHHRRGRTQHRASTLRATIAPDDDSARPTAGPRPAPPTVQRPR